VAAGLFWQSGRGKAAPARRLYLASQNDRWGYMDANGQIQIPARYEFASAFRGSQYFYRDFENMARGQPLQHTYQKRYF
jgi:hypothetical protein